MRAPGFAVAAVVCGAIVVLGGCGDDSGETANPAPQAAGPKAVGAPGAPGGPAKTLLTEKMHIEDRVACRIPEQPSDPKGGTCDPKAPSCGDHLYCMQLAQGYFCEPCPERDGIRHVFKERDFVAEQNRDPFEAGGGLGPRGAGPTPPPTEKCRRDDQMVATSYSYLDLKLVGIVAQGTQRKVLMMGGPLGYIIKRGDCVGKEKAIVTDIGTGYITFQIDPDPTGFSQRPPTEYSVQLNPKQLAALDPNELPMSAPRTTIAPVVAPPPVIPPAGGPTRVAPGAGDPAAGSGAPAVSPTGPTATPLPVSPTAPGAPRSPTALPPSPTAPPVTPPTVSPSGMAPPIAPAPAIVPKRP